jgi:hypothetical protein
VWSSCWKTEGLLKVRQILLFVVCERNLILDCNYKFYLNTHFTETLLLKYRPNYSTYTSIFSSEDVVAGEMLSVGKLWGKCELLYWLNGEWDVFPEHDGEWFWEQRDEREVCGGGLIRWGYNLDGQLGKWAWGGLIGLR